jgi:hypothetical protein
MPGEGLIDFVHLELQRSAVVAEGMAIKTEDEATQNILRQRATQLRVAAAALMRTTLGLALIARTSRDEASKEQAFEMIELLEGPL